MLLEIAKYAHLANTIIFIFGSYKRNFIFSSSNKNISNKSSLNGFLLPLLQMICMLCAKKKKNETVSVFAHYGVSVNTVFTHLRVPIEENIQFVEWKIPVKRCTHYIIKNDEIQMRLSRSRFYTKTFTIPFFFFFFSLSDHRKCVDSTQSLLFRIRFQSILPPSIIAFIIHLLHIIIENQKKKKTERRILAEMAVEAVTKCTWNKVGWIWISKLYFAPVFVIRETLFLFVFPSVFCISSSYSIPCILIPIYGDSHLAWTLKL